MILRDTIFSTERVTIRVPDPEPDVETVAPATLPGSSFMLAEASRRDALLQSLAYGEPLIRAAAEPTEPQRPLDLEAVEQWLKEQGNAERRRIAELVSHELEQVYAQARAAGAEQGRLEAIARVKSESAGSLEQLAQLAAAAETAFEREAAQLAGQCADIVVEAITRIAGPALASREAALGIVLALLARVKDEREIVIRAAAADVEFLQSQKQALTAASGGRNVVIVADQRVSLGGCIVESKLGSLDGRLETQLAELFSSIRSARAALVEGS